MDLRDEARHCSPQTKGLGIRSVTMCRISQRDGVSCGVGRGLTTAKENWDGMVTFGVKMEYRADGGCGGPSHCLVLSDS